ncbi:activator of 90 kDa heat shock protein ATPase homolog 1 [Clonorchis sinensis]|uniref:Activator of 90 kDa heat shock protein ATPase homolog 1 n=1 Tax=Clonorchis sinensis TaxID=79923 RepID=G7YUN9_CLOSI|nr:activator of 90 kDa heat shock protein ATPase homolog 1 [Clonorchis sinensis]
MEAGSSRARPTGQKKAGVTETARKENGTDCSQNSRSHSSNIPDRRQQDTAIGCKVYRNCDAVSAPVADFADHKEVQLPHVALEAVHSSIKDRTLVPYSVYYRVKLASCNQLEQAFGSLTLGTRKTGDNKTKFKGKVEIPNLSEEYSVEELDVSVTCTSSSADGDAIRNFMQTVGAKAIKEKLGQYLKLLHEEYSRDLILPTKGQNTTNQLPKESSRALPNDVRRKDTDHSKQPKDLSVREIHLNDEFFCTPDDLYKVLTTKELVQAFTRGEATVNAVQGGEYCIFGGNISGTFTSLTPGKSIEMQWRKREWPESHHSILCIELNSFEGGTQLKLSQKGIPAYDVENTKNGWQSNFFASVKQTYGYGGRMF